MTASLLKRSFSLVLVFLALPLSAGAAKVADTLKTPDSASVSRGEFIRATVIVSGASVKRDSTVPYKRVSKALIPYIAVAHGRGALAHFGENLTLSKAMTRGDAAEFLAGYLTLSPRTNGKTFRDIKKGSSLEKAAWVMIEKGWMEPLRATQFGPDRPLSGRDARLLLRKAFGETVAPDKTATDKTQTIVVRFKSKARTPLPNEDLLRTIWQLLTEQFLREENIDEEEAAYRAAEAIVESVKDPYTTFLRPLPAKQFQNQIEGEVSGIGAQVEMKDGVLTIVAPLPGSPAEKAGVKPADQILKVDGVSIEDMSLLEATEKVRGPKGSSARFTIRRDGFEFDVTITRDIVRVPEIDISFQGRVAVVKLVQFGQLTERELRSLMVDIAKQQPTGVILDLRNNPGGLLHAASIVLGNFLPQGSAVAVIKGRNETFTEVTEDPPTIDPGTPVIVLVNKGSASASEIVAGALQDAKRARVLGEQTFGKGTVQQILEFRDGSGLKMTVAEWLTPSGRVIDGKGITPDIIQQPGEGRDEQMLKALELLR